MKTNKMNNGAKNAMNFKNVKEGKTLMMKEYRSLSHAWQYLEAFWGLFEDEAKTAGLTACPSIGWIRNQLNEVPFGKSGKLYVSGNKFVRQDRGGSYVEKESFTPAYVLNMIVRAAGVVWKRNNAVAKEVAKERKSK